MAQKNTLKLIASSFPQLHLLAYELTEMHRNKQKMKRVYMQQVFM